MKTQSRLYPDWGSVFFRIANADYLWNSWLRFFGETPQVLLRSHNHHHRSRLRLEWPGLNIGQSHDIEDFFNWFVGDKILEKLESQIAEYKAPKRALEFIGYLNLSKVQEQDSVKKVDKTKKNIFPAPDGTKWQDVSIGFNNKVQITIAISKVKSIFTVEEWSKVMPSKKSSNFLSIIISNSGVFHKGSFKGAQLKNYNQYLSNLRTELKSLFNIDEDPFKVNKPSGHQTLFACYSELMPSTEYPSLSPEDNTPKEIKKQTDAYQ